MNKLSKNQVFTILATLLTIIVNILANTLPLNGQETGEISDRFEIFFVPAGYVFSIWGLIYLGLLAFTIYQALPSNKDNELIKKISPAYWISNLANTAWIFLWHYEVFFLTLPAMITILVSLLLVYRHLSTRHIDLDWKQKWFVKFPFSIYLGWISVATIANVSQVLFFYNWGGWNIPAEIWTVIMLVVATSIGLIMRWRENDALYTLVLVWAFYGITVSQAESSWVANSSLVAAGLLAFTVLMKPIVMLFSGKKG